jgi:hypothetical protein
MFAGRSEERKVLREPALLFRTGSEANEAKWPQERWNLYQRFEQVRERLGEHLSPRYLSCGV